MKWYPLISEKRNENKTTGADGFVTKSEEKKKNNADVYLPYTAVNV